MGMRPYPHEWREKAWKELHSSSSTEADKEIAANILGLMGRGEAWKAMLLDNAQRAAFEAKYGKLEQIAPVGMR